MTKPVGSSIAVQSQVNTSEENWNTKKDKGSTMMLATVYVATVVSKKCKSRDEVTSNSEEIKRISPSVVELCLAEGIRQSVSQIVEIQSNRKFQNFVTTCWKGLGLAFLDLALPNQYYQTVEKEM